MNKTCTGCKLLKALEEFDLHPKGRFGRHPKCKVCRSSSGAAYFKREKVAILLRQRKFRLVKGSWRLRRRYGLSHEQLDKMLADQDGRCAICQKRKPLCVDHDHATGVVRGLLCVSCNLGLGAFKDNPNLLRCATSYLEAMADGVSAALTGRINRPPL